MKILALRFENINSLAGSWEIRFDDEAFLKNSLFAISGPTGAGKSTILDAIVLALYAKTPREAAFKESNANFVMTVGTAFCFSEVEFEAGGMRYMARWELRRARNKVDGAFQQPKHSLKFFKDGSYKAEDSIDKIAEVRNKIIKVVGLDFEQFTRSVLLPQGNFDRFLKCNSTERSAVLEKISGEPIYRQISKEVYGRANAEKEQLATINANISEIQLPSDEDIQNAQLKVNAIKNTIVELGKLIVACENSERVLNEISDKEKKCNVLRLSVSELKRNAEALKSVRLKLDRSDVAKKLNSPFFQLQELRRNVEKKRNLIQNQKGMIEKLKIDFVNVSAELENKNKTLDNLKKENSNRVDLREKIYAMDEGLNRLNSDLAELSPKIKSLQENLNKAKTSKINAVIELEKLEETLSSCKKDQKDHSLYENLSDHIERFESQIKNFEKDRNSLGETEKKYKDKKKTLSELKTRSELLSVELEKAYLERESCMAKNLDKVVLFVRNSLKENEPCPVCGSGLHPYCKMATESVEDVSVPVERLNSAQKKYEKIKADYDKACSEKDFVESSFAEIEKEFSNESESFEEQVNAILKDLSLYGFTKIDLGFPQIVIQKVKRMADYWKTLSEKITNSEKEIDKKRQKIDFLERELANFQTNADELDLSYSEKNRLFKEQRIERERLFGTKSIAADKEEWNEKIDTANKIYSESDLQLKDIEIKLGTFKNSVVSLSDELSNESKSLRLKEDEFKTLLLSEKFTSEDDFKSSFIPDEEYDRLKKEISENNEAYLKKSGELENAENSLLASKNSDNAKESMSVISERKEILLQEKEKAETERNSLSERLTEIKINKERFEKLAEQRIAKEKVCKVWSTLCDMIGSAEGNKFVEYVQGLTLNNLILAANVHLKQLSSRYELRRNLSEKLDIVLYDSECGAERISTNLSGGESFLVSLSLALGLSSLASRKVRIDTLFLDEGFGTLDEKTLQKSIEVLREIGMRSGKLVGVISHVERLKEEIPTRLEISPLGGGRSSISGVGVRCFSDKNCRD